MTKLPFTLFFGPFLLPLTTVIGPVVEGSLQGSRASAIDVSALALATYEALQVCIQTIMISNACIH